METIGGLDKKGFVKHGSTVVGASESVKVPKMWFRV